MLLFLASVIEQLDLALEQLAKQDAHSSRFGLMLTDNALELVLHQLVKYKRAEAGSWRYREQPYPHAAQLKQAYLGSFSDKIAFARRVDLLDETAARSFNILHDYRNTVYHAGLAHEQILGALARFYFAAACATIARYEPLGLSWGSGQALPERAAKYFAGDRMFPGSHAEFVAACDTMAAACGHDPADLIAQLADDLDQIVEDMDACLQIVADGVYEGQRTTRDRAIVELQTWELAFEPAGQAFAAERGVTGNPLVLADFLAANYPLVTRRDPIPAWTAQGRRLRANRDQHRALDQYQAFIERTGPLRAALEQSAAAAEAEMDAAYDRYRGK